MRKMFILAGLMLMACFTKAHAEADPNFYIYLCFGQSNMEGNATPEAIDKEYVDPRFQMLACVDFSNPARAKGQWYTAYPPIVRQGTGLGMADYFGRTMVANLPENVKNAKIDKPDPVTSRKWNIDQRLISLSELTGKSFAIINEAEGKAFYGTDYEDLAYDNTATAFDDNNSGYLFKI